MTRFERLSIGTKLYAAFAVVIVFLCILVANSLASLSSMNAGVSALNDDVVPGLMQLGAVTTGAQAVRQGQYALAAAPTAKRAAHIARDLAAAEAAVARAFARYEPLIGGDAADRRRFEAARASWRAYLKHSRRSTQDGSRDGARAVTILDAADPLWNRLETALAAWSKANRAESDRVSRRSDATFRRSGTFALAVIALALLLASGIVIVVERSLDRGRGTDEREPETPPVAPVDAVVPTTSHSPQLGAEPAGEIDVAEHQPDTVEIAPETDEEAPRRAASTTAVVGRASEGAEELIGAAEEAPATFPERIGEIVAVVTDLADRANLLALHASVAADRAGEHDLGFAEVAGAIRKSADESQATAGGISARIEAILSSADFEGIADVAVTTTGLAAQSEQLALDVVLEAGRAGGDRGRFAAVTGEVRKLADASQAAAAQVSALADEIRIDRRAEPVAI